MTTDEIVGDIQAAYLRLTEAAARLRYLHDHYLDDLQATVARQREALEQDALAARAAVEASHEERLGTANHAFRASTEAIGAQLEAATTTTPWALGNWDAPHWPGYIPPPEAPAPTCVRVGQFDLPDAVGIPPLPALARFVGHGHLFVTGDESALTASRQLLQTVVLRLVLSTSPGTVRLNLFDPAGSGTSLATLLRLPDALRGEKILTRPEELQRRLGELAAHVDDVVQTRLLNLYPSVEAYNAATTGLAVPYHLLVLADIPAGFDQRSAELLLHLARNGPRAGVYIVASLNEALPTPREFDLGELTHLGITLRLTAADRLTWNDPEFGDYAVIPDVLPPADQVNTWLAAVGQTAQQASTSVPFARLAIPAGERWQGSSVEHLRVPIGVDAAGEMHHLELGTGVVYHGLIGGIIRSGKSNLLHVLITQLALRYSPDELELYLVDLKAGVEFQNYLAYRLPHARVIAREGEPEFALSMLRRLRAEIEERARSFPPFVSNLTEYRRQTGECLPRIVIVIDEFHVLFSDQEPMAAGGGRLAGEAARLLEDVARRGAGFGLHLLLCSQSPASASAGFQGNRRIYDQMGLRIALQCRSTDAQAILGEGNDAANQLERPGEAIYNDDRGLKEHNVFLRTALLSAADRQHYLGVIQELAQDRIYPAPLTFNGRAPAQLTENPELAQLLAEPKWAAPMGPLKAWLGESVEIGPPTAALFERYMRANLLIAGGDEAEGYGLLLATLISLAAQRSPRDATFTIVDLARPGSPVASIFSQLSDALPHAIDLASPRETEAILDRLLAALDDRLAGDAHAAPNHFVIVAGLHRWRELRGDPYRPPKASEGLLRLADEGPDVGIQLVVWVDAVSSLDRVKRGATALFDLRVALRVPDSDSMALLGSPIAARLDDNRALFRHEDWESGRVEKFKPYTVSEDEGLGALLKAIAAKASRPIPAPFTPFGAEG